MRLFRTPYLPTLIRLAGMSVGIFMTTFSLAQRPQKLDDPTVFTIVEKQPEFPGGMGALSTFIKTNINYPPEAEKAGIKGTVYLSFIVERDGSRTAITVLQGPGHGCDEEAIRLVRIMPNWIPGSQDGQALRVKYNLPIRFGIPEPVRKVK
ncbi:energy transducer TonB [Spirosoma linguale]|uniref:TonB family protein n=1 Tax=Spirosoma linguale (strain ATCC 33905 / DSM 74 / LMG 10896 / Claus 1) TaxID=504472 RepID=D2QQ96_SPILD|nr:TonB family protein [Spirosoma linguale DSM 74]